VDYSNWLAPEDSLTTPYSVTSDTTDFVVSNVSLPATGKRLIFFVAGGSANEVATVTISVTTNRGEVKIVTLQFTMVSP
jgi:hypothetical protein